MQTIWSRIVQSRISCHCPSCTSPGLSGVARRTTTTAGRRPVRSLVSSTFVYSSIFAAAATTDAGFKQKRRDQWDRAIADIKHDLEIPTPEKHMSPKHTHAGQAVEEETVRYTPVTEEPLEALVENAPLHDDGMPIWPTNTGIPLKRTFVAPNSIYATEWARRKALQNRWTPKKLRITEFSVDKLILRMLIHLEDQGLRRNLQDIVPESCLSFFNTPLDHLTTLLIYTNNQHIDAVHAETFADFNHLFPQHEHGVSYFEDETGEHHDTANQLNTALGLLFQSRKDNEISHGELVAKICYNLYISDAPPNIDTWNTLLTGLLQRDTDVPVLLPVRLAIRNANVRMNEITLRSILKSYIITDDPHGFGEFVDRMRGLNGGLALTRELEHISEAAQPRLVRDDTTGKVIQMPYPTPGVFEVLVQGVLQFAGFEAALRVCKDMGQQGWGLSIRGLTTLLDDRATQADWDSGNQVWDLIKELQQESRRAGRAERLFAQTYTAMLRLCSANNQETRFNEILQEALEDKHASRRLLGLFKREMQPRKPRIVKIKDFHQVRHYHWGKFMDPEKLRQVVTKKYAAAAMTTTEMAELSGNDAPWSRWDDEFEVADDNEWLDSAMDPGRGVE